MSKDFIWYTINDYSSLTAFKKIRTLNAAESKVFLYFRTTANSPSLILSENFMEHPQLYRNLKDSIWIRSLVTYSVVMSTASACVASYNAYWVGVSMFGVLDVVYPRPKRELF